MISSRRSDRNTAAIRRVGGSVDDQHGDLSLGMHGGERLREDPGVRQVVARHDGAGFHDGVARPFPLRHLQDCVGLFAALWQQSTLASFRELRERGMGDDEIGFLALDLLASTPAHSSAVLALRSSSANWRAIASRLRFGEVGIEHGESIVSAFHPVAFRQRRHTGERLSRRMCAASRGRSPRATPRYVDGGFSQLPAREIEDVPARPHVESRVQARPARASPRAA